jgi:general stress protein 26
METDRLLALARKLIDDLTFCVAVTQGEGGDANARVVQPRPLGEDWSVDVLTNRRCRKVREIERTGRLTLLYQHDRDRSYVSLVGRAEIVDDVAFKRSVWTPAHDRWNPAGPEDPATIYLRLITERIELWSAMHDVMPAPVGYSAAILLRDGTHWHCSTT